MKKYKVNEIFYSLQGEGLRAGTANVFVRFSDCNLACKVDGPMGFDCDTEFKSGKEMTLEELVCEVERVDNKSKCVIFTGGEPALQLDKELIAAFSEWYRSIETNGTLDLPEGLNWICVSPKTAEHTLKVKVANEVKYVRRMGQDIPKPSIRADHFLVSPCFNGRGVHMDDLAWCINLVKSNPSWRMSTQQHKLWGVR